MKPTHIIAIDPDIDKSGVAFLNVKKKTLEVDNLTLMELFNYLAYAKDKKEDDQHLKVVIEKSWGTSRVFNIHPKDNVRTASKKGYNVGKNHQIGIDIVEMVKYLELPFIEQPPLVKIWKGRGRKITHPEIEKLTGIKTRTNQETRDAILLAWYTAGYSFKI